MELKNKKNLVKIFVALWFLLFVYLFVMNSGLLPLKIDYDVNAENPFISNLWPRNAYEIQGESLTVHDSIYLDLELNTDFEDLSVYIDGIAFSDTDIKLILKENFEAGPILIEDLKMNEWTQLDLSALGRQGLLVISLEKGESYQLNDLILEFRSAKWLQRFK